MPTVPARPGRAPAAPSRSRDAAATPPPGRPPAPPRPAAAAAGRPGVAPRPRSRASAGSLVAAAALARLPGRGAALRLEQGRTRSPSSRPATAPTDQPGTTYLLVGSDSRAGPERRAAQGARHRQRRRASAPTRSCCCTPAAGPNLLMSIPRDSIGRHPGPRHHQDQRRLRLRRPQAAGPDHRAEHRHPHRPLRRDRLRRLRRRRRRGRRHRRSARRSTMKDKLANLDIKKGCQQADGITALGYARSRHTDKHRRHRPRRAPARGRLRGRPRGGLALDDPQPVRYWRVNMAAPDSFAFGEGTGPSGPPCWPRR